MLKGAAYEAALNTRQRFNGTKANSAHTSTYNTEEAYFIYDATISQ
jgi:citrate lyase synthetase